MAILEAFFNIPVFPCNNLIDNQKKGGCHIDGGPLWDDWSDHNAHRHHISGLPVDRKPDAFLVQEPPIVERAYWSGACCNHYGHFIVDFCSRLSVYSSASADIPLIVTIKNTSGWKSPEDLPIYAKDIYSYFGFDSNRILIVSRPVKVSTLFSVPQQEQHGESSNLSIVL